MGRGGLLLLLGRLMTRAGAGAATFLMLPANSGEGGWDWAGEGLGRSVGRSISDWESKSSSQQPHTSHRIAAVAKSSSAMYTPKHTLLTCHNTHTLQAAATTTAMDSAAAGGGGEEPLAVTLQRAIDASLGGDRAAQAFLEGLATPDLGSVSGVGIHSIRVAYRSIGID